MTVLISTSQSERSEYERFRSLFPASVEPSSSLSVLEMTAMNFAAAAVRASTPSAQAILAATNFRVASMSVAAYDYFITLHSEIRLYRSASRRSLGFILFLLIRYSSIVIIVISNTGFFYHHFSDAACARYCVLAPIFKVFQVMVSQAILGIRAYHISQRRTWVARSLLFTYIVAVAIQWFADFYRRFTVRIDGNCTTAYSHPDFLISAWTFYFAAMIFDCLALSISTVYLLKLRTQALPQSTASKLWRILLYDGLGYFVVLTATNTMNIFLFRGASIVTETSAASLAYTITWIMSQRILLHPREATEEQSSVTVSRLPTVPLRFVGGTKHDEDKTKQTLSVDLPVKSVDNSASEYDLAVRIEQSIVTDAVGINGDDESLRRALYTPPPAFIWDAAKAHRTPPPPV
ncbi:hypothetical protein F5148DRAFT_392815 [Russula earlei]|uniref:Uncharacterized protein n=1 Tax=Russula earlei TaxID=71964 RepID=A0ACC0U0X3_9AGAM|nr:hypothetical protein F5148DRAFT_392815 [Russula earlei]